MSEPIFREFRTGDASGTYREYQLDPVVARRIKELRCGLNGERQHSWRALAIAITGFEDQMTGSDLEKLARWTLGENGEEYDAEWGG